MIPIPMPLPPCQEVDDLLSEYLDGELAPRVVARVEVHLATCPGCARLMEELAATIAALHRLPRGGQVEGDGVLPREAVGAR